MLVLKYSTYVTGTRHNCHRKRNLDRSPKGTRALVRRRRQVVARREALWTGQNFDPIKSGSDIRRIGMTDSGVNTRVDNAPAQRKQLRNLMFHCSTVQSALQGCAYEESREKRGFLRSYVTVTRRA